MSSYKERVDIPPLGHNYIYCTFSEPTCYSFGSEGTKCSRCGAIGSEYRIDKLPHDFSEAEIQKATLSSNGKITPVCSVCGARDKASVITIYKASDIKLSTSSYTYSGNVMKPAVKINDSNGDTISSEYYTLTWSNASSKAAGSYTVKVTLRGIYSGTKTLTYNIVPRQVIGLKVSKATNKSIKIAWAKLVEAKAYKVEYSTDGKTWKSVTATKNSCTVSGLQAGTKYRIRVKALDSTWKIAGKESTVLKTGTLTATPKINKLTSTKSKTATVTWDKVTGAKSYTVYTSNDGKTYKAIRTGLTKTSYSITGLKANKTVYVKVTAVNAYGKESAQGAAKSVTVKK